MERPADLGGGAYLDARNPAGLARAIVAAVSTPLQVLDAEGAVVADCVLSGKAVERLPWVYRVEVQTAPLQVFDAVQVSSNETSTVTVRLGIGG